MQSEKPFVELVELESTQSNKHLITHLRQRLVETTRSLRVSFRFRERERVNRDFLEGLTLQMNLKEDKAKNEGRNF